VIAPTEEYEEAGQVVRKVYENYGLEKK